MFVCIIMGHRHLGATEENARIGMVTAERDFGTADADSRASIPPLPGNRDDLSCLFGQILKMSSLCFGFLGRGEMS